MWCLFVLETVLIMVATVATPLKIVQPNTNTTNKEILETETHHIELCAWLQYPALQQFVGSQRVNEYTKIMAGICIQSSTTAVLANPLLLSATRELQIGT